jgi:pimeloyl-ACP methyl ester carboxylesterase
VPGSAEDDRFESKRLPQCLRVWSHVVMTREVLLAVVIVVAALAAILVVIALIVRKLALRAEAQYPPAGRFIEVDGVRLHYVEKGKGPVVVLLHGNGTRAEDFSGSGVLDRLAVDHRVVAFDRPGYGFSERPKNRTWTPERQADLVIRALERMGIEQPVVVGHSWGTLVALALGLDHPQRVRGLVLLSGYYYPTLRPDVVIFSVPAIPVVGDVMRYTVSPILGRLLTPWLLRQMFQPRPVSAAFRVAVPTALMLRPWQLRAAAEEAGLMVPAVATLRRRYGELRIPIRLLAGADDRVAHAERHSVQFHRDVPHANVRVIPGVGHMVHYFAQDEVVGAVDALSRAPRQSGQRSA